MPSPISGTIKGLLTWKYFVLVWSETDRDADRIAGQCCNKVTDAKVFRLPDNRFDYAWSEMPHEFELYSLR
jgi:hypothetical protein